MANTVKLKRSSVSGKAPATTDLDLGELAINTNDGKLYLKKDNGTESVVEVGPVASVAGRTGAVALSTTDVTGLGTIATQDANTVAVTGGTIDGTPVGGTTPAAGTFTTLIGGNDQVNYGQLTGGATTKAIEFKALGSDANVSYAIRSQGTGAIDLAAGSKGVNISNGGTVTAITRTAAGSGYTTIPSVTISAPTTAGGVQAVVTWNALSVQSQPIASGGTGYTVGDILTVSGGTFTTAAQFSVATVSGGVITSVTQANSGQYTVAPANPVSVTGGTGSSATFNLSFGVAATNFTITNAGSGYVEQPTVTFSGGGGSGAAAYASVGSAAIIKGLSGSANATSSLSFHTAGGETLRLVDGGLSANYFAMQSSPAGGAPQFRTFGADTNVSMLLSTKGSSGYIFYTNGFAQQQFIVSHTANAVNYVQVTGGATGSVATISSQGSDAAVGLQLLSKSASIVFTCRNGVQRSFNVADSANTANWIQVQGAATTVAPILSTQGTDTNIDLALTPKGTGRIKFGTHTATSDTAVSGYIEILDAGGTLRKLAVIS